MAQLESKTLTITDGKLAVVTGWREKIEHVLKRVESPQPPTQDLVFVQESKSHEISNSSHSNHFLRVPLDVDHFEDAEEDQSTGDIEPINNDLFFNRNKVIEILSESSILCQQVSFLFSLTFFSLTFFSLFYFKITIQI